MKHGEERHRPERCLIRPVQTIGEWTTEDDPVRLKYTNREYLTISTIFGYLLLFFVIFRRQNSDFRNDKRAIAPSTRSATRWSNDKVESTRTDTSSNEKLKKQNELEEVLFRTFSLAKKLFLLCIFENVHLDHPLQAAKVQMEMVAALEEKALEKEKNEQNSVGCASAIAERFSDSH